MQHFPHCVLWHPVSGYYSNPICNVLCSLWTLQKFWNNLPQQKENYATWKRPKNIQVAKQPDTTYLKSDWSIYQDVYSGVRSTLVYPSIRLWVAGAAILAETPRPPSPQPPSPTPPEGCQGDFRPSQTENLSRMSWVCLGVSSWLDVLKTPLMGGITEAY